MTVSSPAEHTQTLAAALPSWPGGWQLLRACQAPERHARSVLRDLLGRNAGSAFCRAHELDATTSLAAYRQRVPIRNYQALSPWIEDHCEGVDDCSFEPCENGSACVDVVDDYVCECLAGFVGKNISRV